MIKVRIAWLEPDAQEKALELIRESGIVGAVNWLEQAIRHRWICMVALTDGKILGLMIYEFASPDIIAHCLYVRPQYRRERVGEQMIAKLVEKLESRRHKRAVFRLRETNLAGQLFLREQDFTATDVIREHFPDTGEDAYEMAYHYGQAYLREVCRTALLREAS